jgi:hypothetical protein
MYDYYDYKLMNNSVAIIKDHKIIGYNFKGNEIMLEKLVNMQLVRTLKYKDKAYFSDFRDRPILCDNFYKNPYRKSGLPHDIFNAWVLYNMKRRELISEFLFSDLITNLSIVMDTHKVNKQYAHYYYAMEKDNLIRTMCALYRQNEINTLDVDELIKVRKPIKRYNFFFNRWKFNIGDSVKTKIGKFFTRRKNKNQNNSQVKTKKRRFLDNHLTWNKLSFPKKRVFFNGRHIEHPFEALPEDEDSLEGKEEDDLNSQNGDVIQSNVSANGGTNYIPPQLPPRVHTSTSVPLVNSPQIPPIVPSIVEQEEEVELKGDVPDGTPPPLPENNFAVPIFKLDFKHYPLYFPKGECKNEPRQVTTEKFLNLPVPRHYSYQITCQSMDKSIKYKKKCKILKLNHKEVPDVKPHVIYQYWPIINSQWIYHRKTIYNTRKSFLERQCMDNGSVLDINVFQDYRFYITNVFLHSFLGHIEPFTDFRKDRQDWIESRKHWTLRKKSMYTEALKKVCLDPLSHINPKELRKNVFLKDELMNKPLLSAARTINSRSTEIQCILAPIFNQITKVLKTSWNHTKYNKVQQVPPQNILNYTSGLTRNQQGLLFNTYLEEVDYDYHIIGADFKKFDSSQCHKIVSTEILFYKHMLHDDLSQTLLEKYCKYGSGLWTTSYNEKFDNSNNNYFVGQVLATRSSGDAQTTVMNSLLTGCLYTFCIFKTYGAEILEKCRLFVCGDDCIMITPRSVTNFDLLEKLGFKTEMEISRHYSQVEYCSSHFVKVYDETYKRETLYLQPKLGHILSKTALATRNYSNIKQHCSYAVSKIGGLFNEIGYYKEIGLWAAKVYNTYLAKAGKVIVDKHQKYLVNAHKLHVVDQTYKDLAFRYQVSEEMILDFLSSFKNLDVSEQYIEHELVPKIQLMDLKHISEEEKKDFKNFSLHGQHVDINKKIEIHSNILKML